MDSLKNPLTAVPNHLWEKKTLFIENCEYQEGDFNKFTVAYNTLRDNSLPVDLLFSSKRTLHRKPVFHVSNLRVCFDFMKCNIMSPMLRSFYTTLCDFMESSTAKQKVYNSYMLMNIAVAKLDKDLSERYHYATMTKSEKQSIKERIESV
jgi:hypothetical protein